MPGAILTFSGTRLFCRGGDIQPSASIRLSGSARSNARFSPRPKPAQKTRWPGFFSSLASVRLRCLKIAPHLAKLGHNLKLVIDRDAPAIVRYGSFFEADAYINFKTTFNLGPYLGEAADLGKTVIVDICDNVFSGPDATVHEPLLTFATLATAPTQEPADLITSRQAPALVIPD
jgi:hypothetical protein